MRLAGSLDTLEMSGDLLVQKLEWQRIAVTSRHRHVQLDRRSTAAGDRIGWIRFGQR